MTIRALPALTGALAARAEAKPSDKALAHWNQNVRAAAGDGDASISILGVIGEDFWGEGVSAKRVAAALRYIGSKPVTVNINSPGGNFMEGVAIYNMLRQHPEAVTVKILGIAASAAAIVAMAGDEIEIAKAGFLMIHNTHLLAYGDRNGFSDISETLAIFDNSLAGLFADRSGNRQDEVAAWMDAETFFDGPGAIDAGFATALLPGDAVKEEKPSQPTALRRVDNALNKAGWTRTEIRAAFKEITGTPRAAVNDMPSAVDDEEAGDGLDTLRLAAARLSLLRA
ncbi:ATP-dependent protease ClpP, protease subunit [Bosea lupini]|uniref:ATP-dependent Clp protease proteolytic subunit n=1 Tax=Bosea lupini TaxID=1036779 RepID=A0A1H8AGR0_9HYPH|nr:head maturation protease, ClpP-related [Bosea lupini]SEM69154.1 ATP-dependent protease ClpP, protease subunit [Bosea lupini]